MMGHSGFRKAKPSTKRCDPLAICPPLFKVMALGNDLDSALCTGVASVNDTRLAIRCTHQAEPHIVVAIIRRVPVAIGGTQVLRIVVPTTAAYHAVGA